MQSFFSFFTSFLEFSVFVSFLVVFLVVLRLAKDTAPRQAMETITTVNFFMNGDFREVTIFSAAPDSFARIFTAENMRIGGFAERYCGRSAFAYSLR